MTDTRTKLKEKLEECYRDCNLPRRRHEFAADAILAALPDMVVVPPLEWEDFGGRGAKAKAWGKANYLITKWSDGRFELVESYPGYQGDNLAGGFCATLESAKDAADAHHRSAILAALGVN